PSSVHTACGWRHNPQSVSSSVAAGRTGATIPAVSNSQHESDLKTSREPLPTPLLPVSSPPSVVRNFKNSSPFSLLPPVESQCFQLPSPCPRSPSAPSAPSRGNPFTFCPFSNLKF